MAEHTENSTGEEVKEKVVKEIKWYGKGYLAFIITIAVGLLLAGLALNSFLEITQYLQNEEIADFDDKVTLFIYQYRNEALTQAVIVITEMGAVEAYSILVIGVAIWFLVDKKSIRWVIQSVIILVSTILLNIFIKQYFTRPRPDLDMRLVEAHSYSYPSGHSMVALAFYGFLIYLAYKKVEHTWVKILALIILPFLILAIGASRVYLGVHYPSDVLAGFAVGLFWLLFIISTVTAFKFYRKRRKDKEYVLSLEDQEEDD